MKLSKENLSKEEKRYFKKYGKLPPKNLPTDVDQIILNPTQIQESTQDIIDKITVLCVRFGSKYNQSYVEKLRNMVERHMSLPYEFVCLTDDPTPIPGVRILYQRSSGYKKLWWHKVHMFDSSLDLRGRILYMDLDVVICNSLDKLVKNLNNEFMGIQDFNRKFHPNWKMLNSSVMSWNHRSQSHIWERFCKSPETAQRLHGDQDWIWSTSRDRIKFWPTSWIQSYKWEIRNREDLLHRTGKNGFKNIINPNVSHECSIAVFHGDPKPEDIADPFVIDNWK